MKASALSIVLLLLCVAGEEESCRLPWQERCGEPCLRFIFPSHSPYELDEGDIQGASDASLRLEIRINCEEAPRASILQYGPSRDRGGAGDEDTNMLVEAASGEFSVEGLEGDGLSIVYRLANQGITRSSWTVTREDGSHEAADLELHYFLPLHGRLSVTFPPEEQPFVFKRGVAPFIMSRLVSESQGPGAAFKVEYRLLRGEQTLMTFVAYCPTLTHISIQADGAYDVSLQLMDVHNKHFGDPIRRRFIVDTSKDYQSGSSEQDAKHACPARQDEELGPRGPCCGKEGLCEAEDDLCSGHGICSDGWCVCEGGWAGEFCTHDIESDWEYLPATHPAEAAWSCRQVEDWYKGVEELLSDISAVHASAQGQGPCAAKLAWGADASSAFGTSIRSLGLALSRALPHGLSLGVQGDWPFLLHEGCTSGSLDCYFEPLLDCKASADTELYMRPRTGCPNALQRDCERQAKSEEPLLTGGGYGGTFLDVHGRETPNEARSAVFKLQSPPKRYAHKGVMWWLSNVHAFLLRPNKRTEILVQRARASMGLRGAYIGVHVRHGDACGNNGRECFSAGKIRNATEVLCSKYQVWRVFVATDSPDILGQLKDSDSKIEWHSMPAESRKDGSGDQLYGEMWPQMLRTRMGLLDRRHVAESTITDLMLLAGSDALVIQPSSAFSLLALELAAARSGFIPPYIGLDGPWWPLVS